MKKSFLICFIFLGFSNLMNAQKSKVGVTFSSFGDNAVARLNASYMGDASYDVNKTYTVGFTFLRTLNNWLEFETGIEYINSSITVRPAPMIPEMPSHINKVSIINFPISIRANFWKYCFFNTGILIDNDISSNSSIDAQTGLGGLMGLGLKYDFKSGISIFVNPYLKVHSIIPYNFDTSTQHFLESAVRFGATYQL